MSGQMDKCPICGTDSVIPSRQKRRVVIPVACCLVVVALGIVVASCLWLSANANTDEQSRQNTERVQKQPIEKEKPRWIDGTGYVNGQERRPALPHRTESSKTRARITDGLGGTWSRTLNMGWDLTGHVELRDGGKFVYPGAILTHALKTKPRLELGDYNGDRCVVPFGMTVKVDEYGQFAPIRYAPDEVCQATPSVLEEEAGMRYGHRCFLVVQKTARAGEFKLVGADTMGKTDWHHNAPGAVLVVGVSAGMDIEGTRFDYRHIIVRDRDGILRLARPGMSLEVPCQIKMFRRVYGPGSLVVPPGSKIAE